MESLGRVYTLIRTGVSDTARGSDGRGVSHHNETEHQQDVKPVIHASVKSLPSKVGLSP